MLKYFRASPLWLIGLFIIFAQATAAVAAVQIDGWPQNALVIFVISYSTIVTFTFFLFLWLKPENFYGPSEYGDIRPDHYASALKGLPKETAEAVNKVGLNPLDEDALFELMDSLITEHVKQHLVLMKRSDNKLDISNPDERGWTHDYEIVTRNKGVSFGVFEPSKFMKQLKGTDLVKVNKNKKEIYLTKRGEKFAQWLIENEKDAETFNSDVGRWGIDQTAQEVMDKYYVSKKHNKAH